MVSPSKSFLSSKLGKKFMAEESKEPAHSDTIKKIKTNKKKIFGK